MPINFVTGALGAGKTHHVVGEILLPALRDKRRVFHNLPLVDKKIIRKIPIGRTDLLVKVDDEWIKGLHLWLKDEKYWGSLVIIDEAHEYFPKIGSPKEKALWNFFSYSRHWGYDFVLCTQAISKISRNFDGLWAVEYRFVNQGVRGLFQKQYTCDIYSRGCRSREDRQHHFYKKDIFE